MKQQQQSNEVIARKETIRVVSCRCDTGWKGGGGGAGEAQADSKTHSPQAQTVIEEELTALLRQDTDTLKK